MGALIAYINNQRDESKTDQVCKWTQKGKLKYKGLRVVQQECLAHKQDQHIS